MKKFCAGLLVVGAIIGSGTITPAAEIASTWDASSGNWAVAGNWSNSPATANFPNNGYGGFDYDATLANGGKITLDRNISIDSFMLSNGTLTGAFNLNLDANLSWTGGTMEGTGTTSVSGAASTISGNAAVYLDRVLSNSGILTDSQSWINGGYIDYGNSVAPGVIKNSGTFNMTAGAKFVSDSAIVGEEVNNSGAWNVSGAGTTSYVTPPGAQDLIAFNNTGTVNVTSGTFELDGGGTSTGGAFTVRAGGGLNFGGGTYTLDGASSVSGAGTVNFDAEFSGATWTFNAGTYSVSGTTRLSGGTATFNAPGSTQNLMISGGYLGGTGVLSAGNLSWTGGTMEGTGTTSVSGAASTISGNAAVYLDRVLSNSGILTDSQSWINGGYIDYGNSVAPGVIKNSGTFNMTAGAKFVSDSAIVGEEVNNSGAWNVSGAGTTSYVTPPGAQDLIAFNNTGTVNVTSGTFELDGGGTSTGGAFTVRAGGGLNFGGGTYTLDGASSVSGAGTVNFDAEFSGATWTFNAGTYSVSGTTRLSGGTATFNAPGSTQNLMISGGYLGGTGVLSAGNLSWTGGTMEGTGTTSVSGAASTISGNAAVYLDRVLSNSGILTDSQSWINGGYIDYGNSVAPGVIKNSGTFNMTAGAKFVSDSAIVGEEVNNSGAWNVSGAGTTSYVTPPGAQDLIAFNNTGTVNVTSGTFELDGGGTSTGGSFVVNRGAGLNFNGGTYTVNGASSITGAGGVSFEGGTINYSGVCGLSGTANIAGPVNWEGNTTFDGPVNWSNGNINLSGTITANSGLDIGSSGSVTLSGGVLANAAGSVANILNAGNDNFDVTTGSIFENYGNLVANETGQIFGSGIFKNAGMFEVNTGGNGLVTVNGGLTFNNSGTVEVESGILNLVTGDDGDTTGNFLVDTLTSTIEFNGDFTFGANATLGGIGNIKFIGGLSIIDGDFDFAGTTILGVNSHLQILGDVVLGILDDDGGILDAVGGAIFDGFDLSGGIFDLAGLFFLAEPEPLAAGLARPLAGPDPVVVSNQFNWTGGGIMGAGTLELNGGAIIDSSTSGLVTLSQGTIDLPAGQTVIFQGTGKFEMDSGASFVNSGIFEALNNQIIEDTGTGGATFNNYGTFTRNSTGAFAVGTGVTFNNVGTVNVQAGALALDGTITQHVGNTLTSGTWVVADGATLAFNDGGAPITVNDADVTLGGTGASFAAFKTVTTNGGAMRFLGGANFSVSGIFSNAGVLQLGGGTFSATIVVSNSASQIFGIGRVSAPLQLNSWAMIEPGGAGMTGKLTIQGALTLASNADFLFNLDSTGGGAGRGSSELIATVASLDPSSQFTFNDIAATPGTLAVGTEFIAFQTADGITGTFGDLPNDSIFEVGSNTYEATYSADDLTLTVVVPEPGTWVLVSGGIILLGGMKRFRQRRK